MLTFPMVTCITRCQIRKCRKIVAPDKCSCATACWRVARVDAGVPRLHFVPCFVADSARPRYTKFGLTCCKADSRIDPLSIRCADERGSASLVAALMSYGARSIASV
ncbi:hypothetical protein PHSY_003957 [Pseudozyma hubeiensis SY62]|uniref:Uncharacterized protein n=1 Tax=Pseudozyma hubeiensis (strain SY62) TaxID=1305764 RepID=R9P588_PSEHS|nr:hypothetical protein PHSY_003957 [Pseudozyma hubeiensis SY62]GAC96377.1 hypothetical protein PHSY_003957 [Pseudozyma hubeiensis SY62]